MKKVLLTSAAVVIFSGPAFAGCLERAVTAGLQEVDDVGIQISQSVIVTDADYGVTGIITQVVAEGHPDYVDPGYDGTFMEIVLSASAQATKDLPGFFPGYKQSVAATMSYVIDRAVKDDSAREMWDEAALQRLENPLSSTALQLVDFMQVGPGMVTDTQVAAFQAAFHANSGFGKWFASGPLMDSEG